MKAAPARARTVRGGEEARGTNWRDALGAAGVREQGMDGGQERKGGEVKMTAQLGAVRREGDQIWEKFAGGRSGMVQSGPGAMGQDERSALGTADGREPELAVVLQQTGTLL